MKLFHALLALTAYSSPIQALTSDATNDVQGIHDLANRLFKGHGDQFDIILTEEQQEYSRWNTPVNDNYTVSKGPDGKIRVEGTTLSALSRGLRHYGRDALNLDDFWFVESHKHIPTKLPVPKEPLTGASTVPWRYNLNTVTFSYTFVWYTWQDWERLLDYAALRGVNVQLAWVGYEKIYLDAFRALNLTDAEIIPFFSSPAFQSWNRFGNIKGTWEPEKALSMEWINQQHDLQKKIVQRMVQLGMTPVLPAFPCFVPDAITRVRPDANVIKTNDWGGFPANTSHVSFLNPLDKTYSEIQKLFIDKQIEAFGNVTNVYTLDQFNEITPSSGESDYLASVSKSTYQGLTAANPAAVWMLQGWLFYSSRTFWSQERIDAYLSGPDGKDSMLILDLFSESNPQWQRTKGYSGRPWIWCELHGFGGNMNLQGQIANVTVNAVSALAESDSMVGMGLTPEGYEGNQIMYDLMLDQAWSKTPIDTVSYFAKWVKVRYAGICKIPESLYDAWEILRTSAYNDTDPGVPQVPVAIYQLTPEFSGLVNRTGHSPHPTKVHYDPAEMVHAWSLMHKAATQQPSLYDIPAFHLDFVDVTRQVLTNALNDAYADTLSAFNTKQPAQNIRKLADTMLAMIADLDKVLASDENFTLRKWLQDAKVWGERTGDEETIAFDARTQVTVWGLQSYLNDYAAKAWSGLTIGYFHKRWEIFFDDLVAAAGKDYVLDEKATKAKVRKFETEWQYRGWEDDAQDVKLPQAISEVQSKWSDIFMTK